MNFAPMQCVRSTLVRPQAESVLMVSAGQCLSEDFASSGELRRIMIITTTHPGRVRLQPLFATAYDQHYFLTQRAVIY